MNVGSVCTGIAGLDLGLERAGMRVVFQCEKDAYRRAVLARHFPGVPCFEDIREVAYPQRDERRGPVGRERGEQRSNGRAPEWVGGPRIDLICGGTPCQDLSVAGRRAGLGGERSSLFFEFARIADELVRPGGWLVFENVPGLLSSPGGARSGRDFAVVLATLAHIGFHDLAWRVLDSRYFGVPQRRRRVFIVARRAAGSCAQQILLEPESGGGDFAPGREARTRVAASLTSGSHAAGVNEPGRRKEDDINIVNALDRQAGGPDDNSAQAGHLVARSLTARDRYDGETEDFVVSGTVRSHMRPGSNDNGGVVAHTLRSEGFDASEDGTGRGTPLAIAGPLGGGNDGAGRRSEDDPNLVCPPAHADGVRAAPGLPGSMDGSAEVDPAPDGPRYSACGDAVTVPVAQWIGERIMGHEGLRAAEAARATARVGEPTLTADGR